MLRAETKKLCKKIYCERGFWKQIPYLRSEFYEMIETLQKFSMKSGKKELKRACEEIADFEVMKEQFLKCEGEEKEYFIGKIQLYDLFLVEEELKELYKNLLKVHGFTISTIAHEKAVRTLKRLEVGYYTD